jgi:hypothetical protein
LTFWREQSDNLRGGSSHGHLKAIGKSGVEFSGQLNPPEKGRGFAGMTLLASQLPESLDSFRGVAVDVANCDGRPYCVSLAMAGAAGGVTHDFVFQPEAEQEGVVEMSFREFQPMLRGRPSPVAPPLEPGRVQTISLRADSSSLEEGGDFALTVRSIGGLLGTEAPPPVDPARLGRWECDACGVLNFRAAEVCTRCGAPKAVKEEKARVAAAAEARAKATKWDCDGCGAKNFAAYEDCQKCGAPRGAA